jgi:hypothetical protein
LVGKQKTEGFNALHLTHDLSEIFLLVFCSLLALGAVVGGQFLVFSWNGNYPSHGDLNQKGLCCVQLELKVEVFSLGPLAQIVGKMVTGLASPIATEHGAQKRSAGLLLVDRSLDLITPSCHNDVLLDRVFSSLPRRPAKLRPPHPPGVSSNFQSCPVVRRPVDFRVPTKSYQDGSDKNSSNMGLVFPLFPIMSSWDTVSQGKKYDNSKSTAVEGKNAGVEVMGGSLAVPWDQLGVDRVNSLLEKSTKDGTLLLRKWLHEAWRLEKQTIRGKGRLGTMTLTELASLRTGLASKPDMALRHLSLLQVCCCILGYTVNVSDPTIISWSCTSCGLTITISS